MQGIFNFVRNRYFLIRNAFKKAQEAQNCFEKKIADYQRTLFEEAKKKNKLIILLAGRPYHADVLIQHKVSEMIAALGAYVLTDDVVRLQSLPPSRSTLFIAMGFYQPYLEIGTVGCLPNKMIMCSTCSLLHSVAAPMLF